VIEKGRGPGFALVFGAIRVKIALFILYSFSGYDALQQASAAGSDRPRWALRR